MKQLIKNILIIYFLFTAPLLCAEEISKAFMQEHEDGGFVYIDKKTSVQRSKSSFSTERILQDNRITYKYAAHGEGDYDEYKNTAFDIEAVMEEKDGLQIQVSNATVFQKPHAVLKILKFSAAGHLTYLVSV